MRRCRSHVRAGLIGVAITCGVAGASAADDSAIRLSIDGAPETRFSASCTAITDVGDQTFTLEGTVPVERVVEALGIDCTIRQVGRGGALEIVIEHGNSRSISRTSGGGSTVRMRSGMRGR